MDDEVRQAIEMALKDVEGGKVLSVNIDGRDKAVTAKGIRIVGGVAVISTTGSATVYVPLGRIACIQSNRSAADTMAAMVG
jgi:hypothetical protein